MDYVIVWAGNKNRIKWRMKKGKNKTSRRLHINPRFEQREPCISIEKFQLSFPEIDGVSDSQGWRTGECGLSHTICWQEKLYVYQSQVQWVSDAALVLGWWEKVQSFMLLISTSSYHDKICTSIEAYGTLLLILKANLKISVTLPLYLRDNYLYKQQ